MDPSQPVVTTSVLLVVISDISAREQLIPTRLGLLMQHYVIPVYCISVQYNPYPSILHLHLCKFCYQVVLYSLQERTLMSLLQGEVYILSIFFATFENGQIVGNQILLLGICNKVFVFQKSQGP